jgi:hypothetical protein
MLRWQTAFVLGVVGFVSAAACGGDSGTPGKPGSGATGGVGTGGANGGSAGRGGSAGKGGTAGSGTAGKGGGAGTSSGKGGKGGTGTGGDAGEDSGTGGMGESGSGGTAGAGGSAGTGGSSGMAGEAGAGGESALTPLSGQHVRFFGAAHSYSTQTEAELHALIMTETGIAPTRMHTTSAAATLEVSHFADADIVVVDIVQRTYTTGEATILADWVDAGHGLVILNGFTSNATVAAPLAAPFQITFVGGLLSGPGAGNLIDAADFPDHPITNGVANLIFYGGFALNSGDGMAAPFATISTATVGLARSWGSGRVAVWGDDWVVLTSEVNRMDSGTSTLPTQVFWKNLLGWVARPK